MRLSTSSKACVYLAGLAFFTTCFLGMASDVPIVTLAIRACTAAALCLVLSRILFRIFIEFFVKDTMSSNMRQHTQQPKGAIHGESISNTAKSGE